MKISPRKYALALAEVLEETQEPLIVIKHFLDLLWRRKQFRLLPKILRVFEEEWHRRKKILAICVWYPERFEKTLEELRRSLQKTWQGEIKLTTFPRDDLIGGYQIRFADTLLDASVKNLLEQFKLQTL